MPASEGTLRCSQCDKDIPYLPDETFGEFCDRHRAECPGALHDCGYPDGSFACKIRHVQLNTGWAKSAND